MAAKNSTLTLRWFEQVWNNGQESAIDEMMDTKAVVHGIDAVSKPGPEGFKPFYHSFRKQFPQINVEVENVVSGGGYETSRCIMQATTITGQKVNFTGMTFIQVKDGKITEAWNNFDFLGMYQ